MNSLARARQSAIVGWGVDGVDGESDSTGLAAAMARYCDGAADGFHVLYEEVAPRLLGYLVGLIGERAAAEDLLQLTFLKLHEARASYVRGADPVPWLFTIAHRTFLDETRRRKRARVRLTTEGNLPDDVEIAVAGSDGADGAVAQPELSKVTLSALARLPANQREALILTKVQGHSHVEAAAIVGTTPGAIKLRAHRAYTALRKVLTRAERP